MIPLRLRLQNFLCFGEDVPTLDLDGVRLACLCGQNGHGKSALLDAMTWALWGSARGSDRNRSQDELIYYGREEMLVELDFLARDTSYRVTRRRAAGGARRRTGTADLQLQVYDGSEYRPFTGNTVRETQATINRVTGIDYNTFINSAFLVQGRADEFTNKRPGERKEILAKVLGLEYYDRLGSLSREASERTRDAASRLEGELAHARQRVAAREGHQFQLDEVGRELTQVEASLAAARQEEDALRQQVDHLARQAAELDDLGTRLASMEKDVVTLEEEMETRQARVSQYRALVQDEDAVRAGHARYVELQARYEDLSGSRQEFDRLARAKGDLDMALESSRVRLEARVHELEGRMVRDLGPLAEALPDIGRELEGQEAALRKMEMEEGAIDEKRGQLQDLASTIGALSGAEERLKAEGQELRAKLDLVHSSHQEATCPLCGSQLGPDECRRLEGSYEEQIDEKRREYRRSLDMLKEAEGRKQDREAELPRLEAALRTRQQQAQAALAVAQRREQESSRASEEAVRVREELARSRDDLDQGLYAFEERAKLQQLSDRIRELGYDADAHQQTYREMQAQQPFEERHRQLAQAQAGLPQELDSLSRAQDMYGRRREEMEASRKRQTDIRARVGDLPSLEHELGEATAARAGLDERHRELFRRQVELERELKEVDALRREMDTKEAELGSLRAEQGIYRELTEAFGRRGIQAMIIETALPTVEEEANLLLGRMTDNRMHLKLETQREPRSGRGEPAETLDIVISDEMGPRSYEMFSGGESFRINLALRIALSKVLAHRKGAPLPTLFIDEGFGTQDAAGRERILDVISAIEPDFEKIIVISHMEEVKEAFPVRIEVQKGDTGSTFYIT